MDINDDYNVYESSDEGSYDSDTSDDELRSFIREEYGIKKQCSNLDKKDFENEMEQELNEQMKIIENEIKEDFYNETKLEGDAVVNKNSSSTIAINTEGSAISIPSKKQTDKNISSTASTAEDKMKLAEEKKNDELLYDPKMDEEDQKWIDEQRRSYISPRLGQKQKHKPLPNSDAVLNCPACLSLLCLDCQRHEIYKSQYRAMFVTNCTIDMSQELHYPQKKKSKGANNRNTEDRYHPVKCTVCKTSVAVFDDDEVYHFFNVVSSFT